MVHVWRMHMHMCALHNVRTHVCDSKRLPASARTHALMQPPHTHPLSISRVLLPINAKAQKMHFRPLFQLEGGFLCTDPLPPFDDIQFRKVEEKLKMLINVDGDFNVQGRHKLCEYPHG